MDAFQIVSAHPVLESRIRPVQASEPGSAFQHKPINPDWEMLESEIKDSKRVPGEKKKC